MSSNRALFLKHVGQTSPAPVGLEIERADGVYLYGIDGKKYLDLVSGVSVCNLGHNHPKIVEAVQKQAAKYMHLMVYGEYIEAPQVAFAKLLTDQLPKSLNSLYYVNSGSESIEAAMKLAKRYTGRSEMIAFRKAYHGSTHGALSMGDESLKNAYRPLLPMVRFLDFNEEAQLEAITTKTACVLVEPIQAEGGCILPQNDFLQKLRKKCSEVGALLIFDEVQMGFGRTGKLFAFEHYGVVPDILCLAKAMGGGMPIGGLVADKEVLDTFTYNPVLGHITTFGGHPVSAAAALVSLQILLADDAALVKAVAQKERRYVAAFEQHPKVKEVRHKGLFLAVTLQEEGKLSAFMDVCLELGVINDPFLFYDNTFRIAPPLTISEQEITESIGLLKQALEKI